MPTSFSSKSIGETIAAAHVNALQDAVNDLESGSAIYFVASGSSNAYTGTLSPAVSALTAGFAVAMLANHDNTGAATLDLNSTGAVAIRKTDGATDLESGDVKDGQVYLLVYDGTNWQVVGGGGGGGEAQTVNPATCDARLTLTSGVPVTTADVTGASTVYLTPYRGCLVSLYDGSAWAYHTLTEKSLALSGLTSGKNYDVFLYNNAGTLTLSLSSAWTDDTTRADALAYQDGVRVLASDHTRRLVGTIRATGADTTADSGTTRPAQRLVVNEAHPVARNVYIAIPGSWTYSSDSWRPMNNDAANYITCLGSGGTACSLSVKAYSGSSPVRQTAIGLDSTSSPYHELWSRSNGISVATPTSVNIVMADGYHYMAALEKVGGEVNQEFATFGGVVWT